MVNHVIIMAGGAGKRLWPASNSKRPKQLMELADGKTLLKTTIERALSLKIDGKILIVTHFTQIQGCLEECGKLNQEDQKKMVILGEPQAKNTAPALALAAKWIALNESMEDTMLIMAADHLIEPVENFIKDVQLAEAEANQHHLVTFGIVPHYPSTGYGYIEAAVSEDEVRKVLSFKEKPNQEGAEEFIIKGNYFWNSGMFTYRVDHFFKEMQQHSPEITGIFSSLESSNFPLKIQGNLGYYEPGTAMKVLYEKSPSISIDYAIMEKSSSIKMVKSSFNWNDVGSWDEIAQEKLTPEAEVFGDIGDNFVYSDLPVAIAGVDNLIVVVKNGSVMICPKGESQVVKGLVEEIQEKGRRDLL
ncbi:MAG: mannose-1-phosphate guanylyltransferase [Spirochaetaceae bacterium]|jgi:mannose-1-phosphate guanylyltransferase/mannose-6-phosphate isomerase|nr:mannose-1-phosphate guanylyltransferase [Spirochaetaceae bacterium]